MLSAAQRPAQRPPPAGREQKCIIFRSFFRQRYSRNVKSCCSKIEKIKLFSDQRYSTERIVLVSCFFDKMLCFSSKTLLGVQISKAAFRPWIHQFFDENQLFLMIFDVFRVLPEPLQDRRVDFLTLNFDEKASILDSLSGAF